MSQQRSPIIVGQVYHVFNRSIAKIPIFLERRNYIRTLELINYYRYIKPDIRYSHFNRLPLKEKINFLNNLKKNVKAQVEILAFCLMSNHFHFILKELEENGIKSFMSNIQNSYAKYFNLRNDRIGSLFQAKFKSILIEADEQLIHVCRYIHLNPYSGYIIKSTQEIYDYPWSSFKTYIGEEEFEFVNKSLILGFFSSVEEFEKFTLDAADYQRNISDLKHLILE